MGYECNDIVTEKSPEGFTVVTSLFIHTNNSKCVYTINIVTT